MWLNFLNIVLVLNWFSVAEEKIRKFCPVDKLDKSVGRWHRSHILMTFLFECPTKLILTFFILCCLFNVVHPAALITGGTATVTVSVWPQTLACVWFTCHQTSPKEGVGPRWGVCQWLTWCETAAVSDSQTGHGGRNGDQRAPDTRAGGSQGPCSPASRPPPPTLLCVTSSPPRSQASPAAIDRDRKQVRTLPCRARASGCLSVSAAAAGQSALPLWTQKSSNYLLLL